MPFFTWSQQYSVGVDELDNQHQRLIGIINQLHESVQNDDNSATSGEILKELIAYAKEHFSCEETLMQQSNFPFLGEHKALHNEFTSEIQQMISEYLLGDEKIKHRLCDFLKTWLQEHILKADQLYDGSINVDRQNVG